MVVITEDNMDKNLIEKTKEWVKNRQHANIDNPKTITDKLCWLKVHDNIPLKTKCADKIELHKYCIDKIGQDLCVPILKIYDSPNAINLSELPSRFVLKCNHGSGMNIIINDKTKLNLDEAKSKLTKWLNLNYASTQMELHYGDITRRCYAETFMDNNGKDILDYKFWCFNGEPNFFTINGGNGHGAINHYDMSKHYIGGMSRPDYPSNASANYPFPKHFEQMVEYAKKLSKDFKFVRVDFYEINDKIYLGELTFIPGAGTVKYKDKAFETKVGDMLKL